jgi:hypothetical protein
MLVYRADDTPIDTAAALDRLMVKAAPGGTGTHDALTELFIDLAEVGSAIADRQFPERDGLDPLTTALRAGSLRAAHALIASWAGDPAGRDLELSRVADSLRDVAGRPLPDTIALRISEGYAYYGLHPESYAVAAKRFAGACRPAFAVCIGIRSIGTGLSAMVAASLERLGIGVALHSVRPHGHPFNRRVAIDENLAATLKRAPSGAYFLVVDEGPGLSGSSFASVARALTGLGIPPARVVLFPSWEPDGSAFRSDEAREIWRRHRRFCADGAAAGLSPAQRVDIVDLSGGAWRDVLLGQQCEWPAVHPQHEVAKYWEPASGVITRFAGLGRYGQAKRRRAEALADAGLGPAPGRLANGYLSLPFVKGAPCERVSTPLIDAIARHTSFLPAAFPSSRRPDIDALIEMTVTNIRLGVDDVASGLRLEQYRTALDAAPCCAIDARMFRHEWLHHEGRFVKVDALDHHCDHFFPGMQDAGWDLAAAAFEFSLERAARERLIAAYTAGSGDRDVWRRLPFYDIAYPAFRLGYATLALQSLGGTPDGQRFETIAEQCRGRLRHLLNAPSAP